MQKRHKPNLTFKKAKKYLAVLCGLQRNDFRAADSGKTNSGKTKFMQNKHT